jgi:hypothetical protein
LPCSALFSSLLPLLESGTIDIQPLSPPGRGSRRAQPTSCYDSPGL